MTNDSDFVSSSDLPTNFYSKTQTDTLLGGKVDKIAGKGLSTEDYTSSDKNKLANIEQEANKKIVVNQTGKSTTDVMSQNAVTTVLSSKADSSNLSLVATSGSYSDLLNKPTIPTKTSDLTNDSNFVSSSSLATVATSGSYTDLSNTPTIPTVSDYNASLLLSNWSSTAPYTQTVSVQGILATDTPIVDVVLSSTTSTAISQNASWAFVSKIELPPIL